MALWYPVVRLRSTEGLGPGPWDKFWYKPNDLLDADGRVHLVNIRDTSRGVLVDPAKVQTVTDPETLEAIEYFLNLDAKAAKEWIL
jgi:hypothetical protein